MKKTSLLATNSYLKDRDSRDHFLRRTVLTSSAVEGVHRAVVRALDKISPEALRNSPVVERSEDHNVPR